MSEEGRPSEAEPEDATYRAVFDLFAGSGVVVSKNDQDTSRDVLVVNISGRTRNWAVAVDRATPATSKLPTIFLMEKAGLLAHVGRNGVVCVNDGQGLSVDPERHTDVVATTAWEAYELLERSAADASAGYVEFFNEFEGHWLQMPRLTYGRSSVEVDDVPRQIHVARGRNSSDLWYFTELTGSVPLEFKLSDLLQVRGLYLPLSRAVLPPAPGSLLDARFIDAVLAAAGPDGKAAWEKLLRTFSPKQRRQVRLLLSLPRAAGGRSLVGLGLAVRGGVVDDKEPVIPVSVSRHTAAYMRERGGASPEAGAKRVVILGCGSVGSEVADALASSGVGHLTLVDDDILSEDNVFRHALGREHIGSMKVDGLRTELTRKYPGLSVHAKPLRVEKWLERADWSTIDGVVVAIGQPTLERQISKRLRESSRTIPYVVTWLEPLDLGGHAVALSSQGPGCFDCLFRDEEGRRSLTPGTAFLAEGQKVTRNLTGCASVFVPYGALQSRRTALLATEHILRAMDGTPLPAYAFWVGSGVAATSEGLATSQWWSHAHTCSPKDATARFFAMPCRQCGSNP